MESNPQLLSLLCLKKAHVEKQIGNVTLVTGSAARDPDPREGRRCRQAGPSSPTHASVLVATGGEDSGSPAAGVLP